MPSLLNTTDIRTTLKRYALIILVLLASLYGIFRAYPLLVGPSITIYYPYEGDTVASTTFEVSGKVLRSKEITLQGKSITIDTDGTFRETVVAYPPYTILVITATDSYGKTATKSLQVVPR